jgi:peptide/nickel transport system ATP-binding protein
MAQASTQGSRRLLEVRSLSVVLHSRTAKVFAVDQISYSINQGETLAIVGESGSGKTIANLAPLGLLPVGVLADMRGEVSLGGRNLLKLSEEELRSLRGKEIGVIFQDPLSALNPARTIGRQVAEVAELHLGFSTRAAEARALDLLKMTGIAEPEARLRQYPHELSGGMRQRVMIAIAIAAEPSLLIADEPTTALDVTVQAQIIRLIKDVQKRLGMAVILITHDIGVVSGMADSLAIMYAGRIAEHGSALKVLTTPQHPYTRGLLASLPRHDDKPGSAFRGLGGTPPLLSERIVGCPFAPRCGLKSGPCVVERPILTEIAGDGGHMAACFAITDARARGIA